VDDVLVQVGLTFLRLGLLSVGGFDAVIAEVQRDVTQHGWMSDAGFARVYALSRILPGSGSYAVVPVGHAAAGWQGALMAFLAINVPTTLLAFAVMAGWNRIRANAWPRAFRTAITPIALGLTVASAFVLGRTSIHDLPTLIIAGATVFLMQRTRLPIPFIPPAAGAIGIALGLLR
jgi:chromate transporter